MHNVVYINAAFTLRQANKNCVVLNYLFVCKAYVNQSGILECSNELCAV